MRTLAKPRRREEEEESVFVSMTDMTVSFLFILMILLAFFARSFTAEEMVPAADLIVAQDRAAAAASALQTAEARIGALEDRIRALLDRLETRDAEADALNQALRRERAAVSEANARIEALERVGATFVSADARRADVEAALVAAQATIYALKAQVRDMAGRLEAGDTEIAALRRALQQERAMLSEAMAEVDALDLADMGLKITDLRREATELRARLAEAEAEVERLRAELAKAARPDPLEVYMRGAAASRRIALERLRDVIRQDFPTLDPVISSEADALRFEGEGLFPSGSASLDASRQGIVEVIARRLDEVLPCYTLGDRSAFDESCNPGRGIIEAVQIEGHTDRDGGDVYNMNLSTRRAIATYDAMVSALPGLTDHVNLEAEPVLSVSGYGESRPADRSDTLAAKATNRRIDLRFIMLSPSRSEEIEIIRERLTGGQE